jgi:lipopolysaccharide assembly outer membrane protein LptD (OstA)
MLPLALSANAVTRSALECVPPESLESPLLTGQAVITALEATVTPEKRADLEGNVVILTPQRQLKADRATLDFENDSLTLIDNVSLIDADLCVNGRAASGNFLRVKDR